ncbi:TetR/AcrR family transcriptional regulator [Saccharibacillus sp. CPCC 101409]|uniref:TetR/AcrR family transcriptional regulator n=1 Tax=Saccharibacillus sp. CPCC 101409 TaxID=3058041 RepID=UPI002671736B|nr:TetR/AcrR family transcriptional regulator [Saccharibacillus sp. CPCC 101409]MDO3409986.1 TetR/AcrR family transcriptional regulator [Saccharibacillus sp. CPCC 101409]
MNETWHQYRKQQNREELIAAGRSLFLERGFPNVAVKDVCEQSGVSRVTFYKHFDSLDELIFEVQMEAMEHMANFVRETGRRTAEDPAVPEAQTPRAPSSAAGTDGASVLRAMLEAWTLYASVNRGYMKFILLFDLHYDAYPPERALQERYKTFIDERKADHFLNPALEAGLRDGSLHPDLDLKATSEFVFTAMMGLLQKLSLSPARREMDKEDARGQAEAAISRRFIDMILHSLKNVPELPESGAERR